MTYDKAYEVIDDLLDKAGTSYFTDAEKNTFIDLAVHEHVNELLNSFEAGSENSLKISPLIKTSIIVQSLKSANYPADMFHFVSARDSVTKNPINIISHNEYNAIMDDPFNKSASDNILGLFVDAGLFIDGSLNSIEMTYISNPLLFSEGNTIVTNTDNLGGLTDSSSDDIINIAVRKMLLSLEDPRYQLQVNELTAEKR